MLILASQSPRRAELLRNAGYSFEVRPADVDERVRAGEPREEYVKRLAQEKALAVLATAPAGAVVLGADTTVVLGGECLGKPVDAEDAQQMLARLSGRVHQVMTGVCVAWRKARRRSRARSGFRSGRRGDRGEICGHERRRDCAPTLRPASRWIRRERMRSRAWLRGGFRGYGDATSTWWDCRWRG